MRDLVFLVQICCNIWLISFSTQNKWIIIQTYNLDLGSYKTVSCWHVLIALTLSQYMYIFTLKTFMSSHGLLKNVRIKMQLPSDTRDHQTVLYFVKRTWLIPKLAKVYFSSSHATRLNWDEPYIFMMRYMWWSKHQISKVNTDQFIN